MDKPLCSLCNTRHYGSEPHSFYRSEEGVIILPEAVINIEVTKLSVDKRKTGKHFDKVAYQREYMRKRRAK